MIPYIFLGLAIVFAVIYFLTKDKKEPIKVQAAPKIEEKIETKEKVNYGQICIFYGSQTGTAAKLAEQLGEEATDFGFEPVIVDLKNVAIDFFEVTIALCRAPIKYRSFCYRIQAKVILLIIL